MSKAVSEEEVKSVSHQRSFSPLEEYQHQEARHAMSILDGLNTLRLSRDLYDVTLCAGNQEFPCHKAVLASLSPYFKAMFVTDMAECQQKCIYLSGIEPDTLAELIDYAYTSKITISRKNVQRILSASNFFNILSVRNACCKFLKRNLDVSNCIGIYCFAECHGCPDLQHMAREYICEHFLEVIDQEEFLHLDAPTVIEFLKSDNLKVSKEEDILESALAWLNHDPKKRKNHFDKVLQHVRLPLISPSYIREKVFAEPFINESLACWNVVEKAEPFRSQARIHKTSSKTRPRKYMGEVEVMVAVCGVCNSGNLRSVDCLNVQTRKWFSLAAHPLAICSQSVVITDQNILYMAGGDYPDGSVKNYVWRFDPSLNAWDEMSPMKVARWNCGLAFLDGYIYAVGGVRYGEAKLWKTVERYDIRTDTWTFVAPLTFLPCYPAMAACKDLLYLVDGGVHKTGAVISIVQCYSPEIDCWTDLSPMLTPRFGSAACVVNNLIYVIGGAHPDTGNRTNQVEVYNPETDIWQARNSMRDRRGHPGVAVIEGKIYVYGGVESFNKKYVYLRSVEMYDPEKDIWTVFGLMPKSRGWFGSATLRLPSMIVNDS